MYVLSSYDKRTFLKYVEKILVFLTSYLPGVDICEGTPLLVYGKICVPLTISVQPTYLVLEHTIFL